MSPLQKILYQLEVGSVAIRRGIQTSTFHTKLDNVVCNCPPTYLMSYMNYMNLFVQI